MRLSYRILLPLLLLGSPNLAQPGGGDTMIRDSAALQRLYTNGGVTLQWIGFETPDRGRLTVKLEKGWVHLSGSHAAKGTSEKLTIEGDVLSIDARRFRFRGQIVITDTPDAGRRCMRDGVFDFIATGKRRYWRLQQMEQCDGLTDYVDIYY